MSTNIDHSQLPDISVLEKLANQLFQESNSSQLSDTSAQQLPGGLDPNYDYLIAQSGLAPAVPLSGIHSTVPPSAPGFGASPSIVQNANSIDLRDNNAQTLANSQ